MSPLDGRAATRAALVPVYAAMRGQTAAQELARLPPRELDTAKKTSPT